MSDGYDHNVGKKVCLQLCSLAGYGAASDGALDILSDLVKGFLKECSASARSYAENAGRTEVNAFDIVHTNTFSSSRFPKLLGFESGRFGNAYFFFESIRGNDQVPFGATVPKFPVQPPPERTSSFKSEKLKPLDHIPDYLPAFPAEHTYKETASYVSKQEDEKTKVIRSHDAKKTTEDVLIHLKEDKGNPYLTSLFDGEAQWSVRSPATKRQRKMASNWTELLLGKLQQSDETAEASSQLLPAASLSLLQSDSIDGGRLPKRRKKERKSLKQKHANSSTAPFAAMLKFNLQSKPSPTRDESVNDNPSIATEETSIGAQLPTVQEEASNETEEIDLFGDVGVKTEDVDSTDVLEEWSLPTETPHLEASQDDVQKDDEQ